MPGSCTRWAARCWSAIRGSDSLLTRRSQDGGGSCTATPRRQCNYRPNKAPTRPPPPSLVPLALDRTAGTIGVALSLARQGVQILRVHDVAAVRQALLLFQATGGLA